MALPLRTLSSSRPAPHCLTLDWSGAVALADLLWIELEDLIPAKTNNSIRNGILIHCSQCKTIIIPGIINYIFETNFMLISFITHFGRALEEHKTIC